MTREKQEQKQRQLELEHWKAKVIKKHKIRNHK